MSGAATLISMLICLIFSAFFSASETAYTSFNRTKMKNIAAEGNKSAKKALALAENYDKLLSTILVGNNIVNILASSLATVWFVALMDNSPSAPAVSTAVVTIVILIFGEVTPKSLAKDRPETFAMLFVRPLKFLTVVLTPINGLFMLWKKLLSKIFKAKPDDTVTEGEVLTLVDEAHEDGSVDEYSKELIENIFDFDDLSAGEIATHRTDLTMLSTKDSMEDWDQTINNSRFSRYPVCGERVDDIIGVLDAREYLRLEDKSRDNVFRAAIKPAYFVPETVKADMLFRNMKSKKEYFAIVLDEYGGVRGIVTLTDLVECLVGEFSSFEDSDEPEESIRQVEDSLWEIIGNPSLSDVEEETGICFGDDDSDTFSGFVLGLKGIIPDDGSTFEIERDDYVIRVLEIKDHMVGRAELLRRLTTEDEEDDEADKKKKDASDAEPASVGADSKAESED